MYPSPAPIVLTSCLPRRGKERCIFLFKLVKKPLGHCVQCREDVDAGAGYRFEALDPTLPVVQQVFKVVGRRHVGEVALVELQHDRHFFEKKLLLLQVFLQVPEAGHVFFHFVPLGICDKDHTVNASQDKLSRRVIDDLAGHRVQLEFRPETLKRQGGQRQEIKKQSAVRGGGERDKIASVRRRNPGMDIDQVGRFPA
jgi:hypothetical protein